MGKRQFRVNWQMENLHFNTYEISPNGVNASRNCWVSISELKSPTKMWNCSAKKERECQVEYRFFRRFSQIFTGTFGERVDAVGASWIAQNMRQIKTQIKRETQVMRFYFAIYCQRWRCALIHIHKKKHAKTLRSRTFTYIILCCISRDKLIEITKEPRRLMGSNGWAKAMTKVPESPATHTVLVFQIRRGKLCPLCISYAKRTSPEERPH